MQNIKNIVVTGTVEVAAAQPSEKEVIALFTLVMLLDVLKWIATILSLGLAVENYSNGAKGS